MIVSNKNLVEGKYIDEANKSASLKMLISPKEGWDGYVMRIAELAVGGNSPKHNHDWPHINYIVQGKGKLLIGETVNEIEAGSFAYIPANTQHQFINTGDDRLEFICIVPERGHKF